VYALYRKDWRVATFLVVLFCAQIVLECALLPRVVLQVPYNPICDVTKTHPDSIYFLYGILITFLRLSFKAILLVLASQYGSYISHLVL